MYEGLLFFQIKLTPNRSIMALNIMTLCTAVKEAAHGVSATLSVSLGLMSWRAKKRKHFSFDRYEKMYTFYVFRVLA